MQEEKGWARMPWLTQPPQTVILVQNATAGDQSWPPRTSVPSRAVLLLTQAVGGKGRVLGLNLPTGWPQAPLLCREILLSSNHECSPDSQGCRERQEQAANAAMTINRARSQTHSSWEHKKPAGWMNCRLWSGWWAAGHHWTCLSCRRAQTWNHACQGTHPSQVALHPKSEFN